MPTRDELKTWRLNAYNAALTGLLASKADELDHQRRNPNLLYSVGSLLFEGDLPASIFHMQLITNDIADWKAKSDVVVVFHTNAGHVTLNDASYDMIET